MYVACGSCLQCRTGESHICQHAKIIRVDGNGAFANRSEEVHRIKASVATFAKVRHNDDHPPIPY